MTVAFSEDKKQDFNKKSVSLRQRDFDFEDFEVVTAYDNQGNVLLDAEIYCPQDKAYIILNRVHFRENSSDKRREVLEQFIGYLLCPSNLNYVVSAIYMNILGSNIDDETAKEVGFFPILGIDFFAVLNWSFVETLDNYSISDDEKETILQDYLKLKAKKENFMNAIRTQLVEAKEALQFFQTNTPNSIMVESKEIEVQHLARILNSSEENI